MSKIIKVLLSVIIEQVEEILSPEIITKLNLPSRKEAITHTSTR